MRFYIVLVVLASADHTGGYFYQLGLKDKIVYVVSFLTAHNHRLKRAISYRHKPKRHLKGIFLNYQRFQIFIRSITAMITPSPAEPNASITP